MILKLEIEIWQLPYRPGFEEWIRIIELEEDYTLEDLHYIIQDLVEFDDDHLYEFFVANNTRSSEKERFNDENELVFSKTIGSLYPIKKNKKIFYFFDYGDSWTFRIKKVGARAKKKEPGVEYPRLVEWVGENPKQYLSEDDEW